MYVEFRRLSSKKQFAQTLSFIGCPKADKEYLKKTNGDVEPVGMT